jgi:hypothetical protein
MAGQGWQRGDARAIWMMLCLVMIAGVLAGCRGETEASAEPSGQISRPGDIGLPLENPVSVAAFNVADRFLVKWFLLKDIDQAVRLIQPDLRDSWRPVIEDTEVQRTCSFVQVSGTEPDSAGTVVARYAIGGCQVVSPGGLTAVYLELTLTGSDDGPLVNQVEFLR